jgi:hypothetical protein
MRTKLVLFTLISVFSFDAFSATLRSANEIFPEPTKGGWTQILLGMSELGVAKAVWPGLEREEQALADAQKRLELVKRTPTSEAERLARIEADGHAIAAANSANVQVQVGTASKVSLADELEFLSSTEAISAEQKTALVAKAETDVARAAESALRAAQERGLIERGLRILRKGTAVILAGDMMSRVYVWNVLEANPTLTPIGNYSAELIRALFN